MDRLTELAIKQECTDLVNAYFYAVNEGDLDAFVNTFCEDGIWQRPNVPTMQGHAAIRHFMSGAYDPDPPAVLPEMVMRHVGGSVLVDVQDEDNARIRSQCTVFTHIGASKLPFPLPMAPVGMVVDYRDHAMRTSRGFRLKRRDTTVVFIDDITRARFAAQNKKLWAAAGVAAS
jgi:hypothetical protein